VVATGLARHVSDDSRGHDALRRWSVDGSDVLVALCPTVVTGRRVRVDW
jgi:hypothetical protein